MSNTYAIQTIDLDQLALVTGGQQGGQGTFERLGGTAGEAVGRWGASRVPPPLNIPAQVVLPPAGRWVGETAGRAVDNFIRPFTRPFGGN